VWTWHPLAPVMPVVSGHATIYRESRGAVLFFRDDRGRERIFRLPELCPECGRVFRADGVCTCEGECVCCRCSRIHPRYPD